LAKGRRHPLFSFGCALFIIFYVLPVFIGELLKPDLINWGWDTAMHCSLVFYYYLLLFFCLLGFFLLFCGKRKGTLESDYCLEKETTYVNMKKERKERERK